MVGPVNFNPRTPVGCDRGRFLRFAGIKIQSTHPSGVRPSPTHWPRYSSAISIHAPQWGATNPKRYEFCKRTDFNPRTPVGCDNTGRRCSRARWHFNPRTPVGCDPGSGNHEQTHDISIHAPQWGATCPVPHVVPTTTFQSTHPSGVRPCACRPIGV